MRLTKYLAPGAILRDVEVSGKWKLLDMLSEAIMSSPIVAKEQLSVDEIKTAIINREKQSSTGIGNGFAFPHARLPEFRGIAVALAILKSPLDYNSFDGKPVNVACMVLVPEKTPTLALKAMSQIVKLFSDENERRKLDSAATPEEVYEFLSESDLDLDISITARDIMRPPAFELHPEMPLRAVTRLMSKHHTFAAPVLDAENRVAGEITCQHLFNLGIPDFFTKLKSVAFISDFDPFEKYFYEEAHSKAKDVMLDKFCTMPPDATLFEIVFALTVKRFSKIYITGEDQRLIGVVDQILVLNQIINL